MKKGAKLFVKIIYFVFTFIIGILLALFLPYIFMYYGESVNELQKSLDEGRYSDAMSLVGGYYDKIPVYQEDFAEGGGIVLFAAASLIPSEQDENGEVVEDARLHKAYSGFLYNTKSYYSVSNSTVNKTCLYVTDLDGVEQSYTLLDSDTDEDDQNDCIATYKYKNFIYLDIDKDTYGSIQKLSFADKYGDRIIEIELSLDYSEEFFADVNDFLEAYNKDYKSEQLPAMDEEFRSKSENYMISSTGVAQSNADKKATIIVVVYFIVIYIIADLLIGRRYIIKFGKWLLVKVFKVKFKEKQPKVNEVFGHDYLCKVTLQADLSESPDFKGSVQVRYHNEHDEVTFLLLESSSYTATVPVKAGTYGNLWVDVNTKYSTQQLPDILVAEGYQKQITFKITKRED